MLGGLEWAGMELVVEALDIRDVEMLIHMNAVIHGFLNRPKPTEG